MGSIQYMDILTKKTEPLMTSRSLNVLYNKASLPAIDRFFMQVRRRLSLLERPITSSASLGRRWFGYGPYTPVMVGKLLDIFRVFYNFVEVGRNKQTPAIRLGLAKGKITVENIIYYQ